MKLKLAIKKQIKIKPDVLEEKINNYLKNNFYRIVEKQAGYIIFVNDEYSDRKRARSDFHTRIGKGKFEFSYSSDQETSATLIYFTSLSYYFFLIMASSAFGIYTNNIIMPVVFSFVLAVPYVYRIMYLNQHVFNEILEQ